MDLSFYKQRAPVKFANLPKMLGIRADSWSHVHRLFLPVLRGFYRRLALILFAKAAKNIMSKTIMLAAQVTNSSLIRPPRRRGASLRAAL
jgi:hypothetical protein